MRTPREIYHVYRIMPGLQIHQLRVAAVAQLLCGSATKPVDERAAVLTGLFHDMGNIIKSDLTSFPDFLEPEGCDYWQGVKDEYIATYGHNESEATGTIIREIGLPEKCSAFFEAMGFSRLEAIVQGSIEVQVLQYADMRVGPRGVLSMKARWEEGMQRYANRKPWWLEPEARERVWQLSEQLERTLFQHVSLKPEDITDESIAPYIAKLWDYAVV